MIQFSKLYLHTEVSSFSLKNVSFYSKNINVTYLDVVDDCNEVSLLGWKLKLLKPIYDTLIAKKSPEGKVFLGEEIYFRQKFGWRLK